MSNVKWIKLSTNMFEDEKIRIIEQLPDADTLLIIWIKLLAQAGKTNASGYIYLSENIPYTDEMLATLFNRPLNTVRMALETFKRFNMLEIDENSYICISNWEKHQNIEGLERIREQTRKRVAKHRESKRLESRNGNVTLPVTQSNAIEEELEEDKELDKENKYIRDLFNHYLTKDIIKHRKLTDATRRAIKARLKDYSFDELKKAIDNYATVLKSDLYWFTHIYPLADFMRDKDVRKFLDEADPLNNFLINKSKHGNGQAKNAKKNNQNYNYGF